MEGLLSVVRYKALWLDWTGLDFAPCFVSVKIAFPLRVSEVLKRLIVEALRSDEAREII